MDSFDISTQKKVEFIDITSRIQKIVAGKKIKEGICLVFIPHTTAAITINENADPSVVTDINNYLNHIIPARASYTHAEGNSDAHIKSSLLGASQHLIISGGTLVLGTWQGLYFCEFDGPRSRKIWVKIIEGES